MSPTQPSSKRRWLWLIPAGLLFIGLMVCFAGWQYFKTTPAYTLALLVDAAQQNDRAAFDQVVDLDQVIDNFIAQSPAGSALGAPTQLVWSVRTRLQSLAPEATATIKTAVQDEIQKRTRELAGSTGSRPFVATALAMPFVSDINQTGDTAHVKINKTDEVELVMERREGSWKVVALQDQALAARVVQGIIKALPRSGSPLEEQMRRQLEALPGAIPKIPLINGK
jgi:hypothetical protein